MLNSFFQKDHTPLVTKYILWVIIDDVLSIQHMSLEPASFYIVFRLCIVFQMGSSPSQSDWPSDQVYTEKKSGAKMAPPGSHFEKRLHFLKVEPFLLNNHVWEKKG